MARLLALERDACEVRVVSAQVRGRQPVVEHAFRVVLPPDATEKMIGELLAAELSARDIGRGDVIVSLGRSQVELRQLVLPPCPLDELPDLVRFQALRQFSAMGESWPLDFVHLDAEDAASFHVLAATIAPDAVAQCTSVCRAADLIPRRLVLRPFAAASLVRRLEPGLADKPTLLVDVLAAEADLSVVVQGQVVLVRTVRLPLEPSAVPRFLSAEVRRTLGAAQNQFSGWRVERIVLCGEEHEPGRAALEADVDLPTSIFDPWKLERAGTLPATPPFSGRFAPLLGILADEAAGAAHAIDFLHPRRRPPPPVGRRRWIGAAVAAAVLLLVGPIVWRLQSSRQARAQLAVQLEASKATVKLADKMVADQVDVERFLTGRVVWLDELRRISQKFPPAEKALVTQFSASLQATGAGQIVLDGNVRQEGEEDVIHAIEQGLRDDRHRVLGEGGTVDERHGDYRIRFRETITIEPAKRK